ncbi:cell envelope integrity protein TolA [Brevundimonas sp.]|uniref:cell envelope integrity protein TolA n=1 Tax=Brevundimonas sp. TaxID=1871086 RepID=UPI002D784D8A|nr:cell envelope integrity protein TolA [Brevundimonas sp.]
MALLASAALAGCGTLRGAGNALNEDPRQAYRNPFFDIAKATEANTLALGYALALEGAPRCTLSRDPKGTIVGTPKCESIHDLGLPDHALAIYMDRSIALVDAHCDAYLDSLATLGDSSRWTRTQFNTVTNSLGVLMALAGEPAENLGYLNAVSGFFNSSADNLESFVLVSPTPGKLTPLVRTAREQKLSTLPATRQADNRLMWSSHSRWLQEYASLCTPRGIRGLLDVAIDNTATGDSPLELADAARRLGPGLRDVLSSMARNPDLRNGWPSMTSASEVGALAWLIRSGADLTEAQEKYIKDRISENLVTVVTDAMAAPETRDRLQGLLGGANTSAYDELIRGAQVTEAAQNATERADTAERDAKAAEDRAARSEQDAEKARVEAAQRQAIAEQLQRALAQANENIARLEREVAERARAAPPAPEPEPEPEPEPDPG